MNLIKIKTSLFCFLAATVAAAACELKNEKPLPPPQPASGGGAGGADEYDGNPENDAGGAGGVLIDGEVPTCLEDLD